VHQQKNSKGQANKSLSITHLKNIFEMTSNVEPWNLLITIDKMIPWIYKMVHLCGHYSITQTLKK